MVPDGRPVVVKVGLAMFIVQLLAPALVQVMLIVWLRPKLSITSYAVTVV